MLERGLEAQAEKMSTLEAAAHRLHQAGYPEAQGALGRCQAMLLRYIWFWAVGGVVQQTPQRFPGAEVDAKHPCWPSMWPPRGDERELYQETCPRKLKKGRPNGRAGPEPSG